MKNEKIRMIIINNPDKYKYLILRTESIEFNKILNENYYKPQKKLKK
jgi:hypothetical protein